MLKEALEAEVQGLTYLVIKLRFRSPEGTYFLLLRPPARFTYIGLRKTTVHRP